MIDKFGAGGRGGDATVFGTESAAKGGRGGDGNVGPGGKGGDATVLGNRSYAHGGMGGRGGVGEGGPGGDAAVQADDTLMVGGNGGEAGQPDGRGGRGGSSPWLTLGAPDFQLPDGRWISEFGRGGDGAHSPQHEARLMVIEELLDEFGVRHRRIGNHTHFVVTAELLEALNDRLNRRGWRVEVVDGCFSFYDARGHAIFNCEKT